jgi:hypothetical protein
VLKISLKFRKKVDQEYQKERFVTLRIKESVAREFRKFCTEEATSQSVTLAAMLCFFERHHTRPCDNLPISNKKIEQRILKRLDAIIGIIRNIEANQTLPTVELLTSLFEQEEKQSKRLEKQFQLNTLEEELRQLEDLGRL